MAHPKRMAGFDYHGRHRILISVCAFDRRNPFDDQDVADYVVSQLRLTSRASDVEVTVYALVRDHMHALLSGLTDRAHVPTTVARWKQMTGYWHKRKTGRQLWQVNYWDRVLRAEDETLFYVRYVLDNPLKDGIAQRLDEYRWFGSDCWSRDDLLEIMAANEQPQWWQHDH